MTESPPVQTVIQVPLRARRARVTTLLVAVNVIVYAIGLLSGPAVEDWMITRFGQERLAVWAGEYWRVITGMFVHAGFAHIALNMMALALLGRLLERLLGSWRFATLYFVSGVAGALFFQVFSGATLGLGASGAVYGAFGALLVFKSAARGVGRPKVALKSFVLWTAFVLAFDQIVAMGIEMSAGVGVASSAHLGGLISGSALGYTTLRLYLPVGRHSRRLRGALRFALVALLAGLSIYALAVPPHGEPMERIAAERRVIELSVAGDHEGAIAAWMGDAEPGSFRHRTQGYWLFEELMAADQEALAHQVLEHLIELGAGALTALKEEESPHRGGLGELFNEIAWYSAMLGKDLKQARELADHAVMMTRASARGWPWQWLPPWSDNRRRLGMYLNTRGWIEFRLGDLRPALRDLSEAAELLPVGPNFLYLAWAYYGAREIERSREAARLARRSGGLSRYERILLEELEANLQGA